MADPGKLRELGLLRGEPGDQRLLLSLAGPARLERLLTRLFDESEFLSPHGLRALSAYHREFPYVIDVEGVRATIDYEPAESTTAMFGGNSNWRGPVWFPLNYLVITSLERYHRFFGDEVTLEYPAGSGQRLTLDVIARDLQDRLISIFTRGPGRPPALLRRDPAAPGRPGLARQPGLQRVFPRRQRGRDRRRAPDRVDRADRGRDPPPPRGRPDRRGHPAALRDAGAAVTAPAAGGTATGATPAGPDLPLPGAPFPLGATPRRGGTNFAVASGIADRVDLCLFDEAGAETTRVSLRDFDAGVWHGFLPGIGVGQAYGYRVAGPYDPPRGLRCNPAKLLLDPYAKALHGTVTPGPEILGYADPDSDAPSPADSAARVPRSLVAGEAFDWTDEHRPAYRYEDTIIYEAHVRGLTMRHPGCAPAAARHLRRPGP